MLSEIAMDHLSPVWYRYTDLLVERGEGAYLYTADGTAYLDFTCGIGVTNTGHCHPEVVRAIQDQAAKLLHGQINIVYHQPVLDLVAELRTIFPAELDGYFFSNSGAEAIEGAVKLARMVTGRPNVIVFHGSFHGRTVGAMSLTTSKTVYRAGYQPLMAGVFVAPYPYAYRYGWTPEATRDWCLRELRYLLTTQSAPDETAAMLIEPVLGEGGYVPPPTGFLEGVREICDEHDILLIADEVQSGFGRTGKWFGYEHSAVAPDIVVIAKGLASGLPLSGVVARMDHMQKWRTGSHGGTYGGNPLACAAAAATVRVIREEDLLRNAVSMGEQLMAGLRHFQEAFPVIGDVRGLGLMVAAEFTREGHPAKELAKAVVHGCLEHKLLLLTCGPWDNSVRFIPPLNVSSKQMQDALEIFGCAVEDAAS